MIGKIRKMYTKESRFYKLVTTAPDGRFQGGNDMEGGLDEKTAMFEAEKLKKFGLIVDIFNSKN